MSYKDRAMLMYGIALINILLSFFFGDYFTIIQGMFFLLLGALFEIAHILESKKK